MDTARAPNRLSEPGQMGGHRKPVLEPYRNWVLDQVRRCPELTVKGLWTLLVERGVEVSHDTVWRFLRAGSNALLAFWLLRPTPMVTA
ncbi:hypothetical protein [Paracoccus alkanivorans]|nr:hypothetical protein [Paracoccus alkanivorans]